MLKARLMNYGNRAKLNGKTAKSVLMKGLNRVVLVGNLGRDPEFKLLNDGLPVARMVLATTEVFRLKTGELHTDTQWHTVIVWRSLAELAKKYLKKGSLIYLEGKVRNRSYLDKKGAKKYVSEIIGDRFVMLDKRVANDTSTNSDLLALLTDDTLPF